MHPWRDPVKLIAELNHLPIDDPTRDAQLARQLSLILAPERIGPDEQRKHARTDHHRLRLGSVRYEPIKHGIERDDETVDGLFTHIQDDRLVWLGLDRLKVKIDVRVRRASDERDVVVVGQDSLFLVCFVFINASTKSAGSNLMVFLLIL